MKKCKDCFAHYTGEHICDSLMRMLVKAQQDKLCHECGVETLIPDKEAKPDGKDEWDGHTWKYSCDCYDENLRVCIG